MSAIGAVLHGGRVGSADLELLRDKLFYDRRDQRDALVRFGVLLVLSTVIAAGGVVGDSTATVIGAMIIAPLMTPIMATALSIVTGDAAHLFRSMIVVVVGACASVGLSFCIGLLSVGIDVSSNSQILSRTNPRIIDLVVALATGTVGAFALAREDVSDTLPGVAIAISLVPPLAVVGISLEAGAPSDAAGALLLFGTNVLAILAAGGAVLWFMGYGRVARMSSDGHRRAGTVIIAVGLIAILVPLVAHSVNVASNFRVESDAQQAASTWVDGTGYQLASVTTKGDLVTVVITGQGKVPDEAALAAALDAHHPGTQVVVEVVNATQLGGSSSAG